MCLGCNVFVADATWLDVFGAAMSIRGAGLWLIGHSELICASFCAVSEALLSRHSQHTLSCLSTLQLGSPALMHTPSGQHADNMHLHQLAASALACLC